MSGCRVFHSPIKQLHFGFKGNKQTQIKSIQAGKPKYPSVVVINKDCSVWELWNKPSVNSCKFLTHRVLENGDPALVLCGSILFMFMMIECAEVALFFL